MQSKCTNAHPFSHSVVTESDVTIVTVSDLITDTLVSEESWAPTTKVRDTLVPLCIYSSNAARTPVDV